MSGPQLVGDWQTRARGRVYQQFRNSNWGVPLAELWGARAQRLQAAWGALLQSWSIDPVTSDPADAAYGVGRGVLLDRIGRLLNQGRSGLDDATYRPLLRAKALARKSNGAPDTLIGIFQAMFGGAGAPLYAYAGTAEFILQLVDVVTPALLGPIASSILGQAEVAGVRGILTWQEDVTAAMFAFGVSAYVTAPASAGDSTLVVASTAGFPISGSIIIDQGTVAEETIAYASKTAISFNFSGTLANAHAVHAGAVWTQSPGLGYPARSTPTTSSTSPGTASLPVGNTSGFSSGQAIIDQGTATEETVSVTTIDGTHLGITGTTQKAHLANAAVVLVGSGGKLASAAQP